MTAIICGLVIGFSAPCSRGGHAIPIPPRGGQAAALVEPLEIGQEVARSHGWIGGEWRCLWRLWDRESHWSVTAGYRPGYWHAYGVAQALPPAKMESAGSDWRTSAWTQIKWGAGYIVGRYGTPCAALAHSDAQGFY